MVYLKYYIFFSLSILLFSCGINKKESFIKKNTQFAAKQTSNMLSVLGEASQGQYPRSANADGTLRTTAVNDWTDGFFPGSLWYLYELTHDTLWKQRAEAWTIPLEPMKNLTSHHDIGFLMYCSYGNAYRLSPNDQYKDILIQSAESAIKRFNPMVGCIESWDYRKAWDGKTEWFYPVIIDNMMNLELLCWASKTTGNSIFKDVAVAHANTTMKNHIRSDFSTYHVVDYDEKTGKVMHKATCQGFSDNSTWARGQAWAIYGFTMMFRETGDTLYLQTAKGLADYFLNNPNLPQDKIPFWDFNAGQAGFVPDWKYDPNRFREQPRDVSAAAIVCSALFELQEYLGDKKYLDAAITIMQNLATPTYLAQLGANNSFLLMHSVGSMPHNSEIDVPLVYADYYFIEALVKYNKLNKL